jgi:hypothetical protein
MKLENSLNDEKNKILNKLKKYKFIKGQNEKSFFGKLFAKAH